MLAALRTDIFKREKKKGKKRKEKALEKVGVARLTRFLGKILPVGLDLDNPVVRLACANPPNFAALFILIGLYF
jgi:hypothetical protein